jgi:hypothetical protein
VSVPIADALSFFQLSCGRWRSQRTSHHLLHRRAEAGGSLIVVSDLAADDPRLQAIAELHGQDPAGLVGGCQVRWSGSMAWDKAGEAHEGESVFGLIPTDAAGREGLLLRDRGYAETAPVAGHFRMDDRDGLLLTTAYETMNSLERFWFPNPNLRLRTSTVEGLSNTASFCMESRCMEGSSMESASVASSSLESTGTEGEPVRGGQEMGRGPVASVFGW